MESRLEVIDNQRSHLLGFAVVGIVVAGREHIVADQNSALDLGAKTLCSAQFIYLAQCFGFAGAFCKANPIIAGQIAGGLCWHDDVIDSQSVFAMR